MPRGVKRRRATKNCGGTGCGAPDCGCCWFSSDEDEESTEKAFVDYSARFVDLNAPGAVPACEEPPARQMVAELDVQTLRDLIVDLMPTHPLLFDHVREAYNREHAAGRGDSSASGGPRPSGGLAAAPTPAPAPAPAPAPPPSTNSNMTRTAPAAARAVVPLSQILPVINFDPYSKRAWHALNDPAVLWLSGSRQYIAAGRVWCDIAECVGAIGRRTAAASPWATKASAVETLRKIAKTVLLGEDVVGDEVRRELQWDTALADVMVRVVEGMSPDERMALGRRADEKGTLLDKVRWVVDEADGYCLEGLRGLQDVVQMMETGRCVVSLD